MAGQTQGGPTMEQFEALFRRADLDQDGRISGAEAVAFFEGSNLPKQVLAQLWMYADQSHTGYLGRAEFYNFLKLVTVAQSKRELTPDIVKAALYGPASAKIPAPQINLTAPRAPQINSMAAAPAPQMGAGAPQMGAGAPATSQNLGFRAQVPPNASINRQFFPSQGSQSMRPPVPMATSSASCPLQAFADPNLTRGGRMVSTGLSNSNISSDWLASRTTVSSTGALQVHDRGISPSLAPVAPKPQGTLSTSSLVAVKDSISPVTSGNGFASDSSFGGDLFSTTQSSSTPTSSEPLHSASIVPASSAAVPVTAGPQSTGKLDSFDSLQSTFTRQSTGGQLEQNQSLSKPNHPVSAQNTSLLVPSGVVTQVGNVTPDQSQPPWPKMTRAGVQRHMKVFMEVDTDRDGKITGEQARNLFLSWRLPREVLKQVWDLSDQDNDSMLSLREFCIALYLMERYREGRSLPPTLPSSVLLDETLLSVAGPPSASYGLRPQQGMPGAHSITPTGLSPPVEPMFPQSGGTMQSNQQIAKQPAMDDSHINQLSNGERSILYSKSQETAEIEKRAEDMGKVVLDSKEKLEFYRTKMQDLILYKSRCDNRLNEIVERALADKREAELLAKKYEEKYKQVAEIASKLTIEEASFRDVQERKMELHQAIIKMEQGGSTDGLLQVRADRIQSDLEELLKALTERSKKHGVQIKSTALIELPPGWQPGIPEESVVWDEDWDKFDDEGFSFDVPVSGNTKSTYHQDENSSPNDGFSSDFMSNADGKSDSNFGKGEHAVESEFAYTHSEDESMKSPPGSPGRQTAFESPSQEYSDSQFRKSFEAETETHRSFDESTWGAFDNNDDTDSVWGFNSVKDSDNEKLGKKYFFESSDLAPVRTESPHADNVFSKKGPFFEDSVPSTPLSRAGNSPPSYSVGSGDPLFDNISRYDSFSMHDRGYSPKQESFMRFDSVNSTRGFDHSRGFSFDDSDPFGSSGPFKVSSESQTPRKNSENWSSF